MELVELGVFCQCLLSVVICLKAFSAAKAMSLQESPLIIRS